MVIAPDDSDRFAVRFFEELFNRVGFVLFRFSRFRRGGSGNFRFCIGSFRYFRFLFRKIGIVVLFGSDFLFVGNFHDFD